ncbi:dephospho-CoA kinase [Treponema socranskii]|uniref:dephospho-CoA kinase n=1 Tax=Treponema socranskii TaxID=53419 RepID=UPI003D6F8AE8
MIICVTGPMAAGKNAAAKLLEKRGWLCIDADTLVHEAIESESDKIIRTFSQDAKKRGIDIVRQDGSVDRRSLGKLVFSDASLLAKQEAIVYPAIEKCAMQKIDSHEAKNIALNAAVLYKTPTLMRLCRAILYVEAPLLVRLLRAKKRDGDAVRAICKRFRAQRGLYRNYKQTGIPIVKLRNASSLSALERNTEKALRRIESLNETLK